jgi:ribosomal protein S18 acetylase RimI-like enzyme
VADITYCTKADYDQITRDIVDFWGSDRTLHLHHPSLIYEFGDTAFVIKDGDMVMAYLLGYYAQNSPTAYTHLIGVRGAFRGQGLGRQLYTHFESIARAHGCTHIKAITSLTNHQSIAFHKRIGMELTGESRTEDGIPYVKDYSGPGQHRVVFRKRL